jgi:hypothetical protein
VTESFLVSISVALTHCCFFSLFLQCLRFNIPEDDDAHMVFLALPRFKDENEETAIKAKKVEEYAVEQTLQLSKLREKGSTLPQKFPNPPPADAAGLMKDFLQMVDSKGGSKGQGCKVVISNPHTGSTRTMESFYFTPIVLNNVRQTVRANEDELDTQPLEGYSICFNNHVNAHVEVQMVMEVVMVNENPLAEEVKNDNNKGGFDTDTHLTPLTQQLTESVSAANSVLREMRHMEKRETRMRITSDHINVRVQYFTYISVAVLLVVTYVQVSYLKRYFQKKKIL